MKHPIVLVRRRVGAVAMRHDEGVAKESPDLVSTTSAEIQRTNPYPNPLDGKSGSVVESIQSLTLTELKELEKHINYERATRVDTGPGVYRSASYYRYRSGSWLETVRQEISAKSEPITSDYESLRDLCRYHALREWKRDKPVNSAPAGD